MAKRVFQATGYTATATSDSTTQLAQSTYQCIRGGSATQKIDVLEVLISGLASASTICVMQLARSGLIGSTSLVLAAPNSDGAEDASTAALTSPPLTYVGTSTGTTGPARSSAITDARLNLAINGFGGIIRWNAAPTQQWNMLTCTVPAGESILSATNAGGGGSGVVSSHVIYEPY
jgi:hypothetical protein